MDEDYLATVDTTKERNFQKSDSDDGDFEIVNKELIVVKMASNGTEGDGDQVKRKQSFNELSENHDKFPEQMSHSSKKSNWNTMEVGEKRKRLRLVIENNFFFFLCLSSKQLRELDHLCITMWRRQYQI